MSAGRLKAAQAAVDKALKKSPKSQPALILRMAILEKAGGSERDVLKAYKAAKALGEPSARGVWWISVVFRNMQRRESLSSWRMGFYVADFTSLVPEDLTLQMYTELWSTRPQNPELGEQVFLHAVAAWDKETMCSSSRKMFNMLKSQAWARVAAWAEFISVSTSTVECELRTGRKLQSPRQISHLASQLLPMPCG
jgi:N-terminal acetyltransferase B complex non-catalytic subunit